MKVRSFCEKFLDQRLVTFQTDSHGQPVNCIYIEACANVKKELYLGAVLDRSSQRVIFMVSTEGGMNIEEVADKTPHLLHKVAIDPLVGAMPYQGRELAFKLGLQGKQIQQFSQIFCQLGKLFVEKRSRFTGN
ncbi:succinyl-CoA ligase subunit beta [Pasteurella bettyae]|nr:succinyl-CoA ligase subunit beta [Pasteurella bettyae]